MFFVMKVYRVDVGQKRSRMLDETLLSLGCQGPLRNGNMLLIVC